MLVALIAKNELDEKYPEIMTKLNEILKVLS